MTTTGLYTGSFDPLHVGHIGTIQHALLKVDRVIVAVCGNPAKQDRYLFKLREAGALACSTLHAHGISDERVRVITSEHSMVNIALDFGVDLIIRGARDADERRYEEESFEQIKSMLPTWTRLVVLTPHSGVEKVSSTMVKGMVAEGMDASQYVSAATKAAMEEAMLGQHRIAVVGQPHTGKTVLCKWLAAVFGYVAERYEVNAEPEAVMHEDCFGVQRLVQEESILAGVTRWRDLPEDDNPSLKFLPKMPRALLQPFAERRRRQFLKKTAAKFILLEDDGLDIVGPAANNHIVMTGWGDTADLEMEAGRLLATSDSGTIFKVEQPSRETTDKLHTNVRATLERRRQQHENRWAVPTHKEARRGGLWDDDAGRAHADGQESVPEAGGDGRP